ncbi:helix-turn-helix domain-containing protein [Paracoccus sp. N5]|uniref:helix-turn-helix domain-containing protein n=1 Tax=Paracoccus sp. N5 TaxID=1101189 RepID=UPI00035FF853|nr:helix-turn-helix domain-containing protein [Paracoccus sp. N5]
MSRRPTVARFSLSASARQHIDAIMATARDQIEAVLQREVSRLIADAHDGANQKAAHHRPAKQEVMATPAVPQPIYIRPGKAQQMFGVHRATLYRWANAGHITIHKRGAATFVRLDEVRAFIEGNQP